MWCQGSVVDRSTRNSRVTGSNTTRGLTPLYPWARYLTRNCLTRLKGINEYPFRACVSAWMLMRSTNPHAQLLDGEVSCEVGWLWLVQEADYKPATSTFTLTRRRVYKTLFVIFNIIITLYFIGHDVKWFEGIKHTILYEKLSIRMLQDHNFHVNSSIRPPTWILGLMSYSKYFLMMNGLV